MYEPRVLIQIGLALMAAILSWGVDLVQVGPGTISNPSPFMKRGSA